jgi:hypothetical protein
MVNRPLTALFALALAAMALAASGCTTKQQLLTLDAASKLMKLGRQFMTEQCDAAKRDCIRAKDLKCEPLKKCEKVEKHVYLSTATGQVMAETAGAVIKAGDKERGKVLLEQVLKRLADIREILKAWGIEL